MCLFCQRAAEAVAGVGEEEKQGNAESDEAVVELRQLGRGRGMTVEQESARTARVLLGIEVELDKGGAGVVRALA